MLRLLIVVFAAVISFQVLLPPFIGMANNGDFQKVTGRFALGPEGGDWENFAYFKTEYVFDPRLRWHSEVLSSEILLAAAAVAAAKVAGFGSRFDIRFLGTVHALLVIAAYAIFVRAMRPLPRHVRISAAVTAFVIFTDVAYVGYFNTFYSDAAALAGLALTLALALYLLLNTPSRAMVLAFAASAVLLATAKSQHAIPAAAAAALPLWLAHRAQQRLMCYAAAVAILAASAWSIAATPKLYMLPALFNVIFYQIAADSDNPTADLRELGLDASYDRYTGLHAYVPASPAADIPWLEEFGRRTSYRRLAEFYVRHAERVIAIANEVTRDEAAPVRPWNLSNFRRVDGRKPAELTYRVAWWSRFRSAVFKLWPMHIVVWYIAVAGFAARSLARTRSPLAALCLIVVLAGIFEFSVAAFADACETYRHLFFFHALTDVTICFAVAATAAYVVGRYRGLPARSTM